MNKRLKPLSCALATIFTLTIAVSSPKLGPFSVDTVSAATGTAPVTPAKPTTPAKTNTSTKTTTSSTSTSITRILKFNSMGNDVKNLQTSLNSKGYKLTVDGIFGKLTLAAVKDYQGKNGLVVDGLVGPATLAKLNAKPATPVKPVTPKPTVPPVVTPPVDVVTAASLVSDAATFEKSIGKDGKWIICTLNDLTINKELVLDGELRNTKLDPTTGLGAVSRKIALYTQDENRKVIDRFTLTAPKLTIKSPEAKLQGGTFKGNVYVTTTNFQLVDATIVGDVYVSATKFTLSKNAKIEGNVYFATQGSKDTFQLLDTSSVTGKQELEVVDAVSTASIVTDDVALEKAMGTKAAGGKWIICSLNDITTTKELVLDGLFKKAETDVKPQRKIGLYTQAKQDGKNTVTAKFTLTAPKLTVKSPEAKIQSSNFVGDLYVSSRNFLLTDATVKGDVYVHSTEFKLAANSKIEGNVYFDNLEAQKTFIIEEGSSVTGEQKLLAEPSMVDAVASASLVETAEDFEKAISKDGKWIICPLKDLVTTKDLVVEGEFTKADKADPTKQVPVTRKIGLYWHDDDQYTTAKYTLQAPSLTLKTKTTIQKGTFIGDLYIEAEGVTLKETKIIGNVYFATQAIKDAFDKSATSVDALSSITGVREVKTK